MIAPTLPDLRDLPAAIRLVKRPTPVPVEFAAADGLCRTLEGPVQYRAGDALLTGRRNERWPVRRDLFDASYAPVPPTRAGSDGLYRKRPAVVLALLLAAPIEVPVGWQADPLRGRPGDWLLRYPDGSHGVVQDAVLRESYGPAADEARWPPPSGSER